MRFASVSTLSGSNLSEIGRVRFCAESGTVLVISRIAMASSSTSDPTILASEAEPAWLTLAAKDAPGDAVWAETEKRISLPIKKSSFHNKMDHEPSKSKMMGATQTSGVVFAAVAARPKSNASFTQAGFRAKEMMSRKRLKAMRALTCRCRCY